MEMGEGEGKKSEHVSRQKKLRAAVTAHQDSNTVAATETIHSTKRA